MNLGKHPELLDRLASGYALGTMRGAARRRFETMAREQLDVRAAARVWQARLASMTELPPAVEPGAEVWTRIDNLVRGQAQAQAMADSRAAALEAPRSWWNGLTLWRVIGASGLAAAVLVFVNATSIQAQLGQEIAALQAKLDTTPEVRYVAVLLDDKATATLLASFDSRHNRLTVQRLTNFHEAEDRSLQLWALPPSGKPRSLGVLGSDPLIRLTAAEPDMREVPALAISLEPKGGVPSDTGPTGPVLFKGALVRPTL